jgi:hypothetical protein
MARQSDYVLLNDGTGRLHIGLHDQFTALATQVLTYLGIPFNDGSTPPRFIGIPQPDGSLNFVAEVPTGTFNAVANINQAAYQYVNVPLHYNPTTDYTTNVTVSDRNGSMLMRTWSGNDTFLDTNANAAPASINGGLGRDTCVYSHAERSYQIESNLDGSFAISGNGISDTLTNIERLDFSDMSVALDINGNAGQSYRLYQAAFNRIPDNGGLKYWIGIMDSGTSLQDVSSAFLLSNEFKTLYGANPINGEFVNRLYSNVLHRAPDQGGYDYWVGLLDNHQIIARDTLINFSESNENQLALIGVIQNGIDLYP